MAASEAYMRLLREYAQAVAVRDERAMVERFERATEAWHAVRAFAGSQEANSDPDMHLVLAFSYAVEAGNATEAKRLYDAMGERYRAAMDGAEAAGASLGNVKLWLKP